MRTSHSKVSNGEILWSTMFWKHVLGIIAKRLETLALLVESKKSTMYFTRKELEMILLFLKHNLCEKMEYIPFIKKALKRLKDSLAVLQRQLTQEEKLRNHYKEHVILDDTHALTLSCQQAEQIKQNIKDYTTFYINLRDICVNNLYPDATYNRRRFSLQILLLMQHLLCDEFKDIKWKKKQAETIFQCLLLDTYEPNKEMAYQILKSVNNFGNVDVVETEVRYNFKENNKDICLSECKNLTFLDLGLESQVRLIIKTALALGNSIRPIDSVTAAYMLKISKLSPVIKNVLQKYSKECSIEDNIKDAVTLQLVSLLYERLQIALSLAKQNIGMAIVKCSLYGYLFCMRSLLSDCDLSEAAMDKSWQNIVANIISLCFELSHVVSVIVNNSSPEGHLPMDLKTLNFNDNVLFSEKEILTPQMVLLCSWRTVKEVSQLFGLLATEASIQTDNSANSLLTGEQIERIMKHLVSLLCETKHRGAFEQAYVGFYQLCTRLWRLTNTTLNSLPMHCLHDILLGITGLMPGYSKLCATRRSAGVPFMIQAVLSSKPKIHDITKISAFRSVMQILLQFTNLENTNNLLGKIKCIMYKNTIFSKYEYLSESVMENRNEYYADVKLDVTEIKTHSMNILRALFRHSQLGDVVKDYIADGLIVAFKNYDNKTWAERNAATLLFSALIIRVFGVQRTKDHINLTTDNKMTERIFFERYPTLLPFILNELRSFVSIDDSIIKSNVQAILLLLSRLYITNYHLNGTDIAWKVDEFVNLVSTCAKSPVQKTRELAARALVPLLTESTAQNIVKKLFLSILAQDTRLSANLTHGYLLQILEILTRLPSAGVQLLKSDVTNFLSAADWILKGLERKNNRFSCFPLATVYIDILHELYNLNKNKIESCNMEDIRYILQQHLIEEDVLRQGPGEQMYKISALRFIFCVEKHTNFSQTMCNGQSTTFSIYSRLLIAPDAEIQSMAWNTIFEILKKESCQQRKLLCTHAIRVVADSIEDMYKYNPKLQDAIFDFLYNCITDTNVCCITDKRKVCSLILKKLHSHDASDIYSQRVNYLRLLGRSMATLIHELKDENLRMEHEEDIYRKVCDSNWIGSISEDIRSSVFNVLYDLFPKDDIDSEHCHTTLDWWTVLLQLLVDDNVNIRCEASKVICKIEPCNELECIERTLLIFFQKFNQMIANKHPGIAISALFCWSVSLFGDENYEMDETDVFNKCRNYDVFEPVRISELCFDLTKSITQRYSIDTTLPSDAVRWMNYRLDTDFSEVSSFKDIVRSFKNNVPILETNLDKILDPTYKDKLLQVLAYEKYLSL
ncbi:thyroid adenoma-associated protein homolog isoform X2 [Pseudomyrmex gracilis]|uniref:thyroid adenoma-associated protein homolog isoform X2 n=1 Tax=Pseudomyrmex gracilis TaxID=219809 RepID=UPI00099596BE|nr:thyroid adenoma-associated protein homolog isoform X2 [Pseudomyrmex gracilis]